MKKHLFAIAAVALMGAPMVASAVPYQIALTQDGVGDAGPDWFGTFDVSDAGFVVTSFNAVIDGITYSHLWQPDYGLVFYGNDSLFTNLLNGFVAPFAFHTGDISTTVLQFDARWDGAPLGRWSLSPCEISSAGSACGGGFFLGSYTVSPIGVPEPGSIALFGLAVAALGFAVRKRQ